MKKKIEESREALRYLRDIRGYSQRKLAQELGCNISSVRRWYQGKHIPCDYFRNRIIAIYTDAVEKP